VAVLFVLTWVVLDAMHVGREIRAVGSNARAAYLAGINTRWTRFLAFVINGALAGMAGLLLASRVHSGQPTAAFGIEFQAIAAAVLGGVSIYGGRGTLHGAVFGVLFLSFLTNGLNLVGVSTFIQETVIGSALILAVWADVALVRRE
jgi:ribose/xylose/arabinose/galactoside ABC-type transport system permease subunit